MDEHKIKVPEFLRKDIEHESVHRDPELERLENAYHEKFGSIDYRAIFIEEDEEFIEKHIRILKKCLKTNRRYEKVAHTLLYKLWEWWVKPIF